MLKNVAALLYIIVLISSAHAEMGQRPEPTVEKKWGLTDLYSSPSPYSVGHGDVTVVQFFDYNCNYCRHSLDHLSKLIEMDKNIRLVFVEYPILSEESREASKAAVAAAMQGKYFEFYKAMLSGSRIGGSRISIAARSAGLNIDKLLKDMSSPHIEEVIERNIALGAELHVDGTPVFFVGDEVFPGSPDDLYSELIKRVEKVRQHGCSICSK